MRALTFKGYIFVCKDIRKCLCVEWKKAVGTIHIACMCLYAKNMYTFGTHISVTHNKGYVCSINANIKGSM